MGGEGKGVGGTGHIWAVRGEGGRTSGSSSKIGCLSLFR